MMDENMQGETQADAIMKLWRHDPGFGEQKALMEPFIRLLTMQQRHCLGLTRSGLDGLQKIGEASYSGDVRKVWGACMASNKDIFAICQGSLKEQAKARYDLWRTFLPITP